MIDDSRSSQPSIKAVPAPTDELVVDPQAPTQQDIELTTTPDDLTPPQLSIAESTTEQTPVGIVANEPVIYQIGVLRKHLQEEAEIERPEFVGALASSISLLVLAALWGFLFSNKLWWVALIYTVGNGVAPFLLWFLLSKLLFKEFHGLRFVWWLNSLFVGGFAWWFFSSPWTGVLMSSVGIVGFSIVDAFFRKQQRKNWEHIGLPQGICKKIRALPETLPDEISIQLDESLQHYNDLQEILQDEHADLPIDVQQLRLDAEFILHNLLLRAQRVSRLYRGRTPRNEEKTNQHIAQENEQINEALRCFHLTVQALIQTSEGQTEALSTLTEMTTQLHLLAHNKAP